MLSMFEPCLLAALLYGEMRGPDMARNILKTVLAHFSVFCMHRCCGSAVRTIRKIYPAEAGPAACWTVSTVSIVTTRRS
jgi:hypothetical protein